ncbi:MAG: hypothetical protein ACD_56C00091G0004 [uncultured bacterium]|nr:MAG: hypothetical protein ACD_56C00091G0004 [uncultured bacterium]
MTDEITSSSQSEALSQLIKDLGIDTLSQDKQNELIIKMTEVLLKRIFLETMDKLGEKGREEYEKMTEGEIIPEQMEAFFREKIHGYEEMVQGVIVEFKEEMMRANQG